MKIKKKIAIIGAGVMGSTFAEQLIRKKLLEKQNLLLIDHDENKLNKAKKELKCQISHDYSGLKKYEIILLAVKPQDFAGLAKVLKEKISPTSTVVSIMAGVKMQKLSSLLGIKKIVRVMPNTPARIGEGISGWCGKNLTQNEKKEIETILNCTGSSISLSKETLIDTTTAISGSGPAYVFFFMEQMVAQGEKLGLSKQQAKKLAIQTFKGASILAQESKDDLNLLREKVTSKGGTTTAALEQFAKSKVGEGIKSGINKAFQRAQELSK